MSETEYKDAQLEILNSMLLELQCQTKGIDRIATALEKFVEAKTAPKAPPKKKNYSGGSEQQRWLEGRY